MHDYDLGHVIRPAVLLSLSFYHFSLFLFSPVAYFFRRMGTNCPTFRRTDASASSMGDDHDGSNSPFNLHHLSVFFLFFFLFSFP